MAHHRAAGRVLEPAAVSEQAAQDVEVDEFVRPPALRAEHDPRRARVVGDGVG